MKIHLAVNGSCGRMGQRIIQLAYQDDQFILRAALEAAGHPLLGQDIGEISGLGKLGQPVVAEMSMTQPVDVVIDFSLPAGTMAVLGSCVARRIPLVVATTGHTAEHKAEIEAAAHQTAILMAPNMSLAMNVLMKLLAQTSELLKDRDFDVEILERHHRFKKDSPSGTALHLAKIVQSAMGQQRLLHGREGIVGERPHTEIGMHAVRVGDNVGEHTVAFSTLGETLELTHRAHSRDCYARGALQAGKFLANRPAGLYSMSDVLGI